MTTVPPPPSPPPPLPVAYMLAHLGICAAVGTVCWVASLYVLADNSVAATLAGVTALALCVALATAYVYTTRQLRVAEPAASLTRTGVLAVLAVLGVVAASALADALASTGARYTRAALVGAGVQLLVVAVLILSRSVQKVAIG